ncbi:MAG TPA: sugar phosphate nucleotidyltransferase [Acidimicrobiales bacterium]|nr:sugar phosphate nucleotidyltransferase [Acidimicrobiales bacterium]
MTLQTVVLAGGLGTRMRPATEKVPKALLPVAGRPFVDWQLELLAARGVRRVLLCVGHLGEQIEAHVGDGSRWGLSVCYSREDGGLLGTGGALRLARERDLLDEEFFVLYGDSYLPVDFDQVAAAFRRSGGAALMTLFRNEGRLEASNACFDGRMVTVYDKRTPRPDMAFVDFGLSVLSRWVVETRTGEGFCDLADVFAALSRDGLLAGHEVAERFYEVGSPAGLADLERHLASAGTRQP